ncbi:MAG: PaaI family thioesterase [Chitinispirillales bacterium]|jgi:acyl-coenzyme A thioesterase PaaI-like protein|nr:PaaI family thioesterase [Chitinispirillales bacterium]
MGYGKWYGNGKIIAGGHSIKVDTRIGKHIERGLNGMRYNTVSRQWNDEGCFICGMDNPAGIKAEFFNCVDEDGQEVLITEFKTADIHRSYLGRTHGGVTSALLDESIGRAAYIRFPEISVVTVDLSVKLRKAVPVNETLYVISQITNATSRMFNGEGKMVDKNGVVLATATGRYFRLPLKDVDLASRRYLKEKMPEFFEI